MPYMQLVKYFSCILDTTSVEGAMSSRPPSGLERLWRRGELDREPRLGLSLERVVASGIELADAEGLGAVSMKRVAERLGFTTMSLYRYVTSKDDLLLLMHDTAAQPAPGFELPAGDWRAKLAHWTRAQNEIARRHPWLDDVRYIERAGTPSQIAWMELGLRALGDVPLGEFEKLAILLLFSGYVSNQTRLAAAAAHGAQEGAFESPDHATEAFGELLRSVLDAEQYPALMRAVQGGAFAPREDPVYLPFDFGLDLILDGVEALLRRQAADPASPSPRPAGAGEG
jgi:AcrR family transcriptional regulator